MLNNLLTKERSSREIVLPFFSISTKFQNAYRGLTSDGKRNCETFGLLYLPFLNNCAVFDNRLSTIKAQNEIIILYLSPMFNFTDAVSPSLAFVSIVSFVSFAFAFVFSISIGNGLLQLSLRAAINMHDGFPEQKPHHRIIDVTRWKIVCIYIFTYGKTLLSLSSR